MRIMIFNKLKQTNMTRNVTFEIEFPLALVAIQYYLALDKKIETIDDFDNCIKKYVYGYGINYYSHDKQRFAEYYLEAKKITEKFF